MAELTVVATPKPWHVYVLLCADGSLYVGCTNNIDKRIAAQSRGVGSKYVRSRRPVKLVALGPELPKPEALQLEALLQGMTRERKLEWVRRHAVAGVRKVANG